MKKSINLRDFDVIEFKNDVIVLNDYMFLHKETPNGQFEYLLGNSIINAKSIATFKKNIKQNVALQKKYGFQYKHIVFPAKAVACKHMFAELGIAISPIFTEKHKHPAVVYAKLDTECFDAYETHCNGVGAANAILPILEKFLKTRLPKPVYKTSVVNCDLAKMYDENDNNKERVVFSHFENVESASEIISTHSCLPGTSGTVSYAINKNALFDRRLLLFGTSSIGMAMRMFSHLFTEVLFLRSTFIIEDIVKNFQPDIVLTGGAERFLINLPNVDFPVPLFLHYLSPEAFKDAKLTDRNFKLLKQLFTMSRAKRVPPAKVSPWYLIRNILMQPLLKKKAFALFQKKRFQKAESIARSFIANNPHVAWSYYILAKVQWSRKARISALRCIEKAIALEPNTQYFIKLKDKYLAKMEEFNCCS